MDAERGVKKEKAATCVVTIGGFGRQADRPDTVYSVMRRSAESDKER